MANNLTFPQAVQKTTEGHWIRRPEWFPEVQVALCVDGRLRVKVHPDKNRLLEVDLGVDDFLATDWEAFQIIDAQQSQKQIEGG